MSRLKVDMLLDDAVSRGEPVSVSWEWLRSLRDAARKQEEDRRALQEEIRNLRNCVTLARLAEKKEDRQDAMNCLILNATEDFLREGPDAEVYHHCRHVAPGAADDLLRGLWWVQRHVDMWAKPTVRLSSSQAVAGHPAMTPCRTVDIVLKVDRGSAWAVEEAWLREFGDGPGRVRLVVEEKE